MSREQRKEKREEVKGKKEQRGMDCFAALAMTGLCAMTGVIRKEQRAEFGGWCDF